MARLMSVAFTEQAVRERAKTVTRRKGWKFLRRGRCRVSDTPNLDEARDQEWAQFGEELEWGTELVVEWGVRFIRPYGAHVSLYGGSEDDAAAAREFVANFTPRGEQQAAVVARRVLYGPWGERDA